MMKIKLTKKNHKKLSLLAALLLCMTVESCGWLGKKDGKSAPKDVAAERQAYAKALKVTVLPTLDCMPAYVAEKAGLFEKMGVDVRLLRRNAQLDCDTAIAGGSVQLSISDEIRLQQLEKNGVAMQLVRKTNTNWQLIGNKTARIKEPKQLGDKMVGMARFSATDYLTDRVLEGVKTDATAFKVQFNDVNLRLKMVSTGDIDAAWLPEPQATAARQEGHPVMADAKKMGYELGAWVCRARTYNDATRRKQIDAFMKAYDAAADSIQKFGLQHYADVMERECHVGKKVVEELANNKKKKEKK